MDLRETQKNWELLAKTDPLYGVLSDPDKRGGRWDQAEFFKTGVSEIEALRIRAAELGHPLKEIGERALDFGCGVGRLSQALARHFNQVVGLDISAEMLKLAQGFDKTGRCRFLLNEKPDLSLFPSSYFELVYSSLVLQHMDPQLAKGYIAEFVRVLEPGGLLVFQLPLKAEGSGLRRALKSLAPKPLLKFYRKLRYGKETPPELEVEMRGVPEREVLDILRKAGAKVLEYSNGWYWAEK